MCIIQVNPLTIPEMHASKAEASDDDTTSAVPSSIPDDGDDCQISHRSMPIIEPSKLAGRSFIMPNDGNRKRLRERIIKSIGAKEEKLLQYSTHIKFICYMNDDEVEETLSCNKLLDLIVYQD